MLNAYSYNNNVRVTLNTAINNVAATLLLDEAVAPLRNPPTSTSTARPARFTLMDDPAAPTKIEVIQATGVSAPAAGIVTLTGVTRGLEGTTAQSWGGGSVVMQAVTQEMLNPPDFYGIGPFAYTGVFGNQAVTIDRAISLSGSVLLRIDTTVTGSALFAEFNAFEAETGRVRNVLSAASMFTETTMQVGTDLEVGGGARFLGRPRINAPVPANSTAPGLAGEVAVDSNYIYVCTAPNTWKRAALSSY